MRRGHEMKVATILQQLCYKCFVSWETQYFCAVNGKWSFELKHELKVCFGEMVEMLHTSNKSDQFWPIRFK